MNKYKLFLAASILTTILAGCGDKETVNTEELVQEYMEEIEGQEEEVGLVYKNLPPKLSTGLAGNLTYEDAVKSVEEAHAKGLAIYVTDEMGDTIRHMGAVLGTKKDTYTLEKDVLGVANFTFSEDLASSLSTISPHIALSSIDGVESSRYLFPNTQIMGGTTYVYPSFASNKVLGTEPEPLDLTLLSKDTTYTHTYVTDPQVSKLLGIYLEDNRVPLEKSIAGIIVGLSGIVNLEKEEYIFEVTEEGNPNAH